MIQLGLPPAQTPITSMLNALAHGEEYQDKVTEGSDDPEPWWADNE